MNYSTAIFLVNREVRAIAVSYEPLATSTAVPKAGAAPFTVFKSMDPTIKVGDFVVIPTNTRWEMTVARVEEVDLDVDYDSQTPMYWIIDGVNTDAFAAIVEKEKGAIATIKSAEKRRRQEELAEKLMADNPDLKALSFGNDTALPAPPAEE